MDSASGSITTQFSENYINLTKDFCCDNGSVKLIRWIGCKPGIYKGAKTIFESGDLGLCSWFQQVENYSFVTVDLTSGSSAELELSKTEFIFGKVNWPTDALKSNKNVEIGLIQQEGLIGSYIPFNIETPNPERYNFFTIKDIINLNTVNALNGKIILNNISPYDITISLLYAY